jgi:pyruvate-ferredoxin/flavodoxin oxidoreductase
LEVPVTARNAITVDGNEAVAMTAYRMNEVIAIYPITPSSPMAEWCDEWAAKGKLNLWGVTPRIVEMQSEGGAAGAIHGALQGGSLSTTFTSSQGLLLMIPNLYRIAGELTGYCMHVAARAIATHALSIFGDHSDVMSCRQTGMAMLCASSVQEAHDLAAIGQAAALRSRVPVMHFFDGFRTSHEVAKIQPLSDDQLHNILDEADIAAHRSRGLTPDRPIIRGTAQNPDVFFQAREAANPFHDAAPAIMQEVMDRFGAWTGRQYHLFDYFGHRRAERVIVLMGSGAEAARETIESLIRSGEKVGLVQVRLYRPFDVAAFIAALPTTTTSIAVLDRCKEPGSIGEPLYLDVLAAIHEAMTSGIAQFPVIPQIVGGRYGLGSKEFTPAMIKGVYDHLKQPNARNHFTVGINDDVTGRSIPFDPDFSTEDPDVYRALFYGLGADGTVSANKNSIKIIGDETDLFAQGYFVYDSKKSGAATISHLRFGPRPIRSTYLIRQAQFVAVHHLPSLERYDALASAAPGGIVLLNCPGDEREVWNHLPANAQRHIVAKRLQVYAIDGNKVASDAGLGGRINTVMQVCFFELAKVIEPELAIRRIKEAIHKAYSKKGDKVVTANLLAVDNALAHLRRIRVPERIDTAIAPVHHLSPDAPDFVKQVTSVMMAGEGDRLPVSAFPPDGTWPVGTTRWEKRNIAREVPEWDSALCIQCNKCAFVCPHSAIRAKAYDAAAISDAPATFKSVAYKAPDLRGMNYTVQLAPDDCTGCGLCVEVCPAKDKKNPDHKAVNMVALNGQSETERENFEFFQNIPQTDRNRILRIDAKGSQFFEPLFEFSGACAGCGETPYLKLLSQLFGDRLLIANATGCSSIYGGNLPTTPWTCNKEGRGPAWSNSLFEDNAEFGLGMRLSVDQHAAVATQLLQNMGERVGSQLVDAILKADQVAEAGIHQQRQRIVELRQILRTIDSPDARRLDSLADYLVRKSVWLVGGDGWAYDIDYGGLDHVIGTRQNVNILVLDTEVYSNTGGQSSKATPLAAAAKFAAAGKQVGKKDMGMLAMTYGHAYVARVAFGANDNHTVRAFMEAESYEGPSLIIAYSHCIAHGYDLRHGLDQQRMAVSAGVWPLYRFDPRRLEQGENPLTIDSGPIRESVADYMSREGRFRMVQAMDADRYTAMTAQVQRSTEMRFEMYRQLASMHIGTTAANASSDASSPAPAGNNA